MSDSDDKQLIKKIDALSENLGFGKNAKTLIKIKRTDDPNIQTLNLEKGSWDSNEPWFIVDEDNLKKIYAMVPAETFSKVIETLKTVQQENFNLKLEKTIWQNIPVDFEDVWVVAMDKIKQIALNSQNKRAINIDLDRLIKDVKKEHPNLFLNFKELFR